MAGISPIRRGRLGAALVAVLLALSVVAGAAGLGTAHGDTDHVVRNGDQVEIRLGDQHDVSEASEITVTVEGVGEVPVSSPDGNETDTFEVSITELAEAETDLAAANVEVSANGTELFNETEDLRHLTFAEDSDNRTLDDDGNLRLPLEHALGYTAGSEVTATLGGGEVTGTVEYGENRSYLSVSLSAEQVAGSLGDSVSLTVDGRDSTDVDLRSLVESATDATLDDDTLLVTNPLLAEGSSYDVMVTTTNPNGTYANGSVARADGLAVTSGAFASAESVAVSVYSDGDPLVENATASAESDGPLTANVTDDGAAITVSGSSLTANETTVWLTNDTDDTDDGRYVTGSVPVDDGTVNLTGTDYRLNENASYRLLVLSDEVVRAELPGNESANDSDDDSLFYAAGGGDPGGSSGESSGGLFSVGSPLFVGGVVVGFVFIGALVFFQFRGGDDDSPAPDEVDSAAVASAHDSGHEVEFRVEDAATGSTVSAGLKARQKADNAAYRSGGPSSEEADLPNGTGSVTLDRGTWAVEVGGYGVSERRELTVPMRGQPVEVTLGPVEVDVTVADGSTPLADVPVTCTPDQGRALEGRTDADGEVTFAVPLAADEVEVSADPDRYDGDAATASVAGGNGASATLDVQPETGDLDVTATVEGTPVGGLPVEVRPRDDETAALGASQRTATTDEDGGASFEDLLVGEYEVEMDVPGGGTAFAAESATARVTDGRTARETLDASFEFSLGRNQRDRIASVRQDVDALVSTSGRDVAIPRYYGSVVTSLLETVERLPREGHRFARADADPDAVADALLDAAESSVELVNDAMTTKRNTDLFGACVDMRDHRVEWDGGFDADQLFELLDEDRTAQRQTVLTQLRAVDDRINDERSDLAVVAPARELWDGVKSFVNTERGDDPVRGAAVAFAASGLLDAVDELFDHEQLRERLQRTVF